MVFALNQLEFEPPPLEEPVKEERITVLRWLHSDNRLVSTPEGMTVNLTCEVTGLIGDDFAIECRNFANGETFRLERINNFFYSIAAVKGMFLLSASRSTLLVEKLEVHLKMRKIPSSHGEQRPNKNRVAGH
jgi:hypothetical protein